MNDKTGLTKRSIFDVAWKIRIQWIVEYPKALDFTHCLLRLLHGISHKADYNARTYQRLEPKLISSAQLLKYHQGIQKSSPSTSHSKASCCSSEQIDHRIADDDGRSMSSAIVGADPQRPLHGHPEAVHSIYLVSSSPLYPWIRLRALTQPASLMADRGDNPNTLMCPK